MHYLRAATLAMPITLVAGLVAAPAWAGDTDIRINEVQSKSLDGSADFVELTNVGAEAVDLSRWVIRDSDDTHTVTIATDTALAPGAYLVIETDSGTDGFGLGSADAARVFASDGTTLIDSYNWTDHASSEGRLPDGTGEFVDTAPTPGAANKARAAAPVVINEVETTGDPRGDWLELANTDPTLTADVSGWTIIDGDPSHQPIVLPAGTQIESGGYLGILSEPRFGLGGNDSVTVRDAAGTIVETVSWDTHPATTLGRCPDMTGPFQETATGTFELVNACAQVVERDVKASPWPFNDEVGTAVRPGTWSEDMSGIDISSDGIVYAVNNDNAEIFELEESNGLFIPQRSWVVSYPDGSGEPDAEGLAVAGDRSIFLATERDNTASGTSRPAILRSEQNESGPTTTHEWNLQEITGNLGANAGLEGIEWIADADATRLGVLDSAGQPYDPAAFGPHFGGLFVVSVEQTSSVHLVALESDGAVTLLQTAKTTESVPVLMGLDWRAGGNELWGLCDEVCDNRHSTFSFEGGVLTWVQDVTAPAGMNASFTNEGVAMAWCDLDRAEPKTVLWISDTAHDRVSLRSTSTPCNETGPPKPAPVDPAGKPDSPEPVPASDLTDDARGGVTAPVSASPGEEITIGIRGSVGEQVRVWLHSDPTLLATATVPADGTVAVVIPADTQFGEHKIVVQVDEDSLLGWAPLEVVAAGATPDDAGPDLDAKPSALAETGLAPIGGLIGALTAMLLGGLVLTRRPGQR